MHDRPMISVVMPLYNCETLVGKSIESVIRQSYSNWELIIVDDCSKDNSYEVACSYAKKDERIRLLRMQQNSGVALARNTAIHEARGEILMYLDSDDIWSPYKMEIQSKYMRESQIVFSCSAYEVIDENGIPKGKVVNMLPSVDYKGFLLNNLIQIVGVAIDLNKISKELLMEDKDMKREDAASWLKILRAGYKCYGLNEVLAQYRRVERSRSSNKVKASKGMWELYRKEGIPFLFASICFVRYAFLAAWKRKYTNDKSCYLVR